MRLAPIPTSLGGLVLAALWLASSVGTAQAQRWSPPTSEPDEGTMQQAREIYRAGSDAIDNENLTDGLSMFEESYRMSGAWMALFAIGRTLNDLGRYEEAEVAFDQLLERHGDLSDEFRVQTNELLAGIRERRSSLLLRSLPDSPAIRLDGVPVLDTEERPLSIETDPGAHRLVVSADGYIDFEWQGEASRGQRTEVEVLMAPVEEGGGVFSSAWFWIIAGALVVGATVTTIVLVQGTQFDPDRATDTRYVVEL